MSIYFVFTYKEGDQEKEVIVKQNDINDTKFMDKFSKTMSNVKSYVKSIGQYCHQKHINNL